MVEFVYEILTRREEALIKACLKARENETDRIYISPFDRVGKSGARLFRAYFCPERDCFPHIVKIDSAEKIKAEYSSFCKVSDYLQPHLIGSPQLPIYEEDVDDPLGVLYFQIVSDSSFDLGRTSQFSDIVFDVSIDPDDEQEKVRQLRGIVETIYGNCLARMADASTAEPEMVSLAEEYSWHIDAVRSLNPESKYKEIIGSSQFGSESVELAGANFFNPTILFKNIVDGEGAWGNAVPRNRRHVHGDLHCNNIVLNKEMQPVLIDFAWAQTNTDILKDFVLLENSLRVVMFPAHVNLSRHLEIDKMLIEEDGPQKVRSFLTGDEPLYRYYIRLLEVLSIIREYARRYAGAGYDWAHYLQSQFITMYRQLSYDTPNSIVGFRTLGLIADAVRERHA